MCRVYNSKQGPYVRLCVRMGRRKGERVYFDGNAPITNDGHYALEGPRQKITRELAVRSKLPMTEAVRLCLGCSSLMSGGRCGDPPPPGEKPTHVGMALLPKLGKHPFITEIAVCDRRTKGVSND